MSDAPDPLPTAEKDATEWAVQAENGTRAHASEEVARRAIVEGGWTLGIERSPIVAAFSRPAGSSEWTPVTPPGGHDE